MLRIPTAEEAEQYIDFAYGLALDPARSGYPTYTDGIKTKEDFQEVCRYPFTHEGRRVLLYEEEGRVSGWIQFLFEEGYLETNVCNIAGDIRKALGEFIAYCGINFPDHTVCMGFPGENREAIQYLTEAGWTCEERSYNNVLFFDRYALLPENDNVVKITRENFSDFRRLHEPVQGDMYWNCDRLYDALADWDIFVYYEAGEPAGAIYNRDSEILMHIYGVDYRNDVYNPEVFRILMAAALNECKRGGKKYMVYFAEDMDQAEALAMGYHCVGEYVLFTNRG